MLVQRCPILWYKILFLGGLKLTQLSVELNGTVFVFFKQLLKSEYCISYIFLKFICSIDHHLSLPQPGLNHGSLHETHFKLFFKETT